MNDDSILSRMFELQRVYSGLYEAYRARGIEKTLDPTDIEHNFDVAWKIPHYYETGADALRLIICGLIQGLHDVPKTVLDFACGSGRVTRHLQAFFPGAHVVACDLYESHVQFCSDVLGAEGFMSKENFNEIDFGVKFDVIFCGSLLTHLPADLFRKAMQLMARSLSDQGIAVVSMQGRHAEFIQRRKYKYIEDELFEVAMAGVDKDGFGYVDYNHHWLTNTWTKQANYGVAMARPHWTLKQLEEDYSIRVLSYTERAWDGSQDVVIFSKPAVNAWMRPGDVEDNEQAAIPAPGFDGWKQFIFKFLFRKVLAQK